MQTFVQILSIGLVAFLFYRMFQGGGCCGGGHNHGSYGGGHGAHGGRSHDHGSYNSAGEIETYKDPICGMYVSADNAITRRINGQTFYFCSESCAREYERKYS